MLVEMSVVEELENFFNKAQIPLGSSRLDKSASSCACSNMADDEQAIVLACTSLVVIYAFTLHKSYLFRQIK